MPQSTIVSSKSSKHMSTHQENALSIMTYNVENLFDTQDDPYKDDYTFLPLKQKQSAKHKERCRKIRQYHWKKECYDLDWSQEHLQIKLENLVHVISSYNSGQGPDILFLQEIENMNALQMLQTELNKKGLAYDHASLIEGKDIRGIDVAFLSKLKPLKAPKIYTIPFKSMSHKRKQDVRGILNLHVQLPNSSDTLALYCVHLPAPYHPKRFRQQALNYLNKLQDKDTQAKYHIAAGDFNITRYESERFDMYQKNAFSHWIVAHLKKKAFRSNSRLGSNYYAKKDSWSFLDAILLSKNFLDQKEWEVDIQSFNVYNKHPILKDRKNRPKSFDTKTGRGISDHFPLVVQIKNLK